MQEKASMKTDGEPEPNSSYEVTDYRLYYRDLGFDMPEARQVALKLASFLERLVEENNNIPCQPTMFDLTKNANISISDFMKRIVDYSYNSPESYVVSLILLEKYVANKENVLVNRFNIHKLLITSSMIAAKFLDDEKISNKSYAQIGGIKNVTDLNLLEIEFLQVINYSLMSDRETFEEILALLEDDDIR